LGIMKRVLSFAAALAVGLSAIAPAAAAPK
jgi:hypothetical protein